MAKSIFETLDDLNTATSVKGQGEVAHTIPRNLFPTAEEFANKELLVEWANKNDYAFSLIQQGLQKGLIDCRAKFRPTAKEEKDDTWTAAIGQARVDAHKWEVMTRPESAKSAEDKAIEALSKLSPEKIAAIMANLKK